jgi:hypothetical protein
MRRFLLAALTAAMVLAMAVPALAHPNIELEQVMPLDLSHSSTDNVEYLGRFPEHWGTAGGRLVGDRYYLTDPRGVYVYDVSTPESPSLLGAIGLYQTTANSGLGTALAQEEPDTDGNILLVDGSPTPFGTAGLQVVDVSDPASMAIIGSLNVTDHTWTCISLPGDARGPGRAIARERTAQRGAPRAAEALAEKTGNGCAYAYGRTGHIIDLTDPTNPVNLDHTWRERVDHGTRGNAGDLYTHDMTEIRPGLVMTAGRTNILMDTSDPANPIELARVEQPGRFSTLGYHSVEWANEGRDPFVVFGTEIAPAPAGPSALENTAGTDCRGENSVIETWDASEIVAGLEAYEQGASVEEAFGDAEFHRIDTFDAGDRGIFLQGQAPGHVLYCAHWMRLHPDFDAGGLMAVSYYDRGTRFVEIADDGTMSEVGWITAAESYSGSPRWASDEVVYISDYRRGFEIVRLTGETATTVETEDADAVMVGSLYVPASSFDLRVSSTAALGFFMLLAFGTELRRRRRTA